ncbi:MAG: AbrB/MazE/SpoVT family DNA-binding domain-containing protein [Acidobacteriia bacterium]|nr:AbrB/MazE/SpoVT family DNA-binding domain-containing protein [Terriglobia bacterium]MYG03794.1 AbrB/MazE/SpoVT family DNA-binding domain-containing protein [Terriglobia bacterium]MYK09796.1 AbrB/MazE/SpoVT family DNA-binding domain-containing protein [Terriglobia bacterium]
MQRRDPETPRSARRTRLFRNGWNQVVRIPPELELATDEVLVHRAGDRLVVGPIRRTPLLAEVLPTLAPLAENFPQIPDPPSEPEDIL